MISYTFESDILSLQMCDSATRWTTFDSWSHHGLTAQLKSPQGCGAPKKRSVPWQDTSADTFTIWLFNIAMENGPFIDGLPIKNGDFPWLC
jgi:hypothetical protein